MPGDRFVPARLHEAGRAWGSCPGANPRNATATLFATQGPLSPRALLTYPARARLIAGHREPTYNFPGTAASEALVVDLFGLIKRFDVRRPKSPAYARPPPLYPSP